MFVQSGETADDYISPNESNDFVSTVHAFNPQCANVSFADQCGQLTAKWKKNLKNLYPCLPVVSLNPYNDFVKAETCNGSVANECAIMRQYEYSCQAQGAFIQTAC